MSTLPRPYPVQARLRYAYRDRGEEQRITEIAWWESRPDGGRALGAVIEAMDAPRDPHRLRIHLRLGPHDEPILMEASLLRPDGEGRATYRLGRRKVVAAGEWNGCAFQAVAAMPPGYTVAPRCFAADGLHFRGAMGGSTARALHAYMLDARKPADPLIGEPTAFTAELVGVEALRIGANWRPAYRFRAGYEGAPDQSADFWVTPAGYTLRMRAPRPDGSVHEIACVRADILLPDAAGRGEPDDEVIGHGSPPSPARGEGGVRGG